MSKVQKAKNSRKKGIVSVETAALLAGVSVPLFIAFQTGSWYFDTSCREGTAGWFEDLCQVETTLLVEGGGSQGGTVTTGSGSGGDSSSGGAGAEEPAGSAEPQIGDSNYDPNRPFKGAWTFGAGQVFAGDPNRDWVHRYEDTHVHAYRYDYRIAAQQGANYGYPDAFARGNYEGYGTVSRNDWFHETRMIALDPSIDCAALGLDVCGAGVSLYPPRPSYAGYESEESFGPSRLTTLNPNIDRIVDYGDMWVNGQGQEFHFRLGMEFGETYGADGTHYSSLNTGIRHHFVAAGGDMSFRVINNSSGAVGTDQTIDANGYNVTVEAHKGAYLDLRNGNFEVGNGHSGYYDAGAANTPHLYAPAGGSVVATYPYAKDGSAAGYASYPALHRVDLRNNPGWSLESCGFREVPFIRDVEASPSYDDARAGEFSGPRTGASVILKNGGQRFELMWVDRPAFTAAECSTNNGNLFVK